MTSQQFPAAPGDAAMHRQDHAVAEDTFCRIVAVHPHLDSAGACLRTALTEVVRWN